LHEELAARAHERRARELLEPEVRIERTAIVVEAAARIGRWGREVDGAESRGRHALRDRRFLERRRGVIDEDLPPAMRHAVGGRAWRAVDRTAACQRIRRDGARVERRILDRVAHRADGFLAGLLDLEERAAGLEPERAALRALELVVDVHVLMRKSDV